MFWARRPVVGSIVLHAYEIGVAFVGSCHGFVLQLGGSFVDLRGLGLLFLDRSPSGFAVLPSGWSC